MMQTILAILLVLHGLVHLLWFVVPWNLMEVDGLPDSKWGGLIDIIILLVLLVGNQYGLSFLPFS